jgi:hypothetical protein
LTEHRSLIDKTLTDRSCMSMRYYLRNAECGADDYG